MNKNELSYQLAENYDAVIYAVCPEEIFGTLSGGKEKMFSDLGRIHAALRQILNPEIFTENRDEQEMAAEARDILQKHFEAAQIKINNGRYGQEVKIKEGNFSIKTAKREYHLQLDPVDVGDIASIYAGYCSNDDSLSSQIVAKVVIERSDNVFLENEATCLDIFRKNPGAQSKHLPILFDRFKTSDGRLGLILRRCEGFTLERVRQNSRYQKGIPDKHVAWMMNRGLSALGYAHSRGVVHCNLAPEHLFIRPRDHNLGILDWIGAAYQRAQPFHFVREGFSAPEVSEKKLPIPSSDIYAFGKCMIYALGGDVESGEMPDSVHPGLQNFLQGFILKSPIQRPEDAWKLHQRLSILRKQWWGPDKFLELKM